MDFSARRRQIWANAKQRSIDGLAITAVAAAIAFFSGSERFTGLYTPDSEFYLSLSSYGHAVTDRSPVPAYYWTRLGEIIPLRLLSRAFGFETAWTLYRFLLVCLIVGSVHLIARKYGVSRTIGATCGGLVVSNTVVLYFLGDPYNTGTVIAWLFVLIFLCLTIDVARDGRRFGVVALGSVGCILLMSNPSGLIVGMALALPVLLARVVIEKGSLKNVVGIVATATLGFLATLGLFFLVAQRMFPALNWYGTVRYYVSVINPSGYASKAVWPWLRTESSLLVPLVCAMLLIAVLVVRQREWRIWIVPTAVAIASPTLFILQFVKSRGSNLEASFYSAMLWPGALAALCVCLFALNSAIHTRRRQVPLVLITGLVASVILGHRAIELKMQNVMLVLAALGLVSLVLTKFGMASALLIIVFPLAQFLQNGRPWGESVLPRNPYVNAYQNTSVGEVVRQNLEAQGWVLSLTFPDDKVLVYADFTPSAVSAAAMQLWGPNAASTNTVAGEWERANIINVRPTVLVTYFRPTKGYAVRRDEFVRGLLDGLMTETSVTCHRFKPANDQKLEVCLRRLQPVTLNQ